MFHYPKDKKKFHIASKTEARSLNTTGETLVYFIDSLGEKGPNNERDRTDVDLGPETCRFKLLVKATVLAKPTTSTNYPETV